MSKFNAVCLLLLMHHLAFAQSNSFRLGTYYNHPSSKYASFDFNFPNPKVLETTPFPTELLHVVYWSYADSNGVTKYIVCHSDDQGNGFYDGGGLYDSNGNMHYTRKGQSIYSAVLPLGNKQVLLLGDSSMIVKEDNLYDTIKTFNYGFTFSPYQQSACFQHNDTMYLFHLDFDSIKCFVASEKAFIRKKSIPTSKYFNSVKYIEKGKVYLKMSIDFNKKYNIGFINLSRTNLNNNSVYDTTENVLIKARFDKKQLTFTNEEIMTRRFRVGSFKWYNLNEPIIYKMLLAPNDSSLYLLSNEKLKNDIEGNYYSNDNAILSRLYLYGDKQEEIIDRARGEDADFFLGANNKFYYTKYNWLSIQNYNKILYEISYPSRAKDEIDFTELGTRFINEDGYSLQLFSFEPDYYQPFIETRMVRRCPTPVFTSSHEQKPDSIHYTLYNADSAIVATSSGERFAPKITQAGKYHLLTTHYRAGFRQFLWSKYYLDVPIKPTFRLEDTLSCRFKALNLKNNTITNVNQPDSVKYEWNLLGVQNQTYIGYNPKIEPKFAGKYSLTLKVANGKCVYTSAPLEFEIQNANSADFIIADTSICLNETTEIKLKNATSILDSVKYKYNQNIENTSNFNFKPQRAGWHIIESKTYSKRGCVNIFSDSLFVNHGFNKNDSIAFTWLSTTSDSTIEFYAIGSSYLSKAFLNINATVIDSFESTPFKYVDSMSSIHSVNSYHIIAVDSCGNSLKSQHQNNIVLHVAQDEKQVLKAEWNKYLNLDNALYILEISFDGINWVEQATTNQLDVEVSLNAIWPNEYAFFRVKLERFGQQPIYSNMVYIKAKPQLFIPNAFSPNGDGVNDSFYVSNYGYVKSGQFSIFSRNGQSVFNSNEIDFSWNGNNSISESMPSGAYYFIYAITNYKNEEELFSGIVFLIR
jgi:gliding motility-associated-like protein